MSEAKPTRRSHSHLCVEVLEDRWVLNGLGLFSHISHLLSSPPMAVANGAMASPAPVLNVLDSALNKLPQTLSVVSDPTQGIVQTAETVVTPILNNVETPVEVPALTLAASHQVSANVASVVQVSVGVDMNVQSGSGTSVNVGAAGNAQTGANTAVSTQANATVSLGASSSGGGGSGGKTGGGTGGKTTGGDGGGLVGNSGGGNTGNAGGNTGSSGNGGAGPGSTSAPHSVAAAPTSGAGIGAVGSANESTAPLVQNIDASPTTASTVTLIATPLQENASGATPSDSADAQAAGTDELSADNSDDSAEQTVSAEPRAADLVTQFQPVELSVLDRGLTLYMDQVSNLGHEVATAVSAIGPAVWLLAGAMGAVAIEVARQHQRRRAGLTDAGHVGYLEWAS